MIAKPSPSSVTTYDLRRADGSMLRALSSKQIRAMALANDLYTDDMITRTGDGNWRSAATLAELPVRKRVVAAVVAKPAVVAPGVVMPDPRIAIAQDRADRLQSSCDELTRACDALRQGEARSHQALAESQAALTSTKRELEQAQLEQECTHETLARAAQSSQQLAELRVESQRATESAACELADVRDAQTRATAELTNELASARLRCQRLVVEAAQRDELERTVAALESTVQAAQESHAALHRTNADLRRQQPDPALVRSLEEAVRERAIAQQQATEATEDRNELVASLSHSQDSLRLADDVRRALEKSVAALKLSASEQASDLVQSRASLADSQGAYAAVLLRAEAAETLTQDSQRVKSEASAWVARTIEQRDAALKSRDSALSDRDGAINERDSTRLAVGATQTDLVRVRREFDSLTGEYTSACGALAEMTARAAALESAVSNARTQYSELVDERDIRDEEIVTLNASVGRLSAQIDELARERDLAHAHVTTGAARSAEAESDRDLARAEVAALHGDLASARESAATSSQRHTALERELAEERSRIVARDELIFRESLRSEERETDNRKLAAALAALRADCDSELRRADDAVAHVSMVLRDLASAQQLATEQASQAAHAQDELENLTLLEHSARAALTAASRERDEVAAALATAHAAVASREQQVSAERQLRDQAEASSRQLLASYEKLADDTGRRITDLEVKLSDANHDMQSVRVREEQVNTALAEAHTQSRALAQKLAAVEEQRTAVTRDRDSHAKRAAAEASARAAAEDKIAIANERAAKAEREARMTSERSLQAAMIALSGSKQRLDGDYAQSRAELEVLEQLVAESSRQLIANGGTVPGVPLLPREAAAKAATDAKAASDAVAMLAAHVQLQATAQAHAQTQTHGAPSAPVSRLESARPATQPVNFRMVSGDTDDTTLARPHASRVVGSSSGSARPGGQRERVSQPRAQSASSSGDDDSSSTSESSRPQPPPNERASREAAKQQGERAITAPTTRASTGQRAAIDEAWIDDHSAVERVEPAPRATGLIAVTALIVACTATLAAIPEFASLDLRSAFMRISAWVIAAPALAAIAQLIAKQCEPTLARRIAILASAMVAVAPLSSLAFASAPWMGVMLAMGSATLPWLLCYAAWPDARQLIGCRPLTTPSNRAVERFAARARSASATTVALATIALVATVTPWATGAPLAILSPTGALCALTLVALIAMSATPSLRSRAPLAAWSALAVIVAFIASALSSHGLTLGVPTVAPGAWIALCAIWSAVAVSSLGAACLSEQLADAVQRVRDDDAPVLVAHERFHAAWVMALSAVVPIVPAMIASHLVRGRSRRAESQLRSLANFELWFAAAIAIATLFTLLFTAQIGSSLLVGLLVAHAAICLGCAVTMSADRFVRFPSPMPLLARPDGGLDLPVPLVTVQRTADGSAHRPIVHPCGTTAWGAVTVILGCLALAAATRSLPITLACGPLLGLALWLPSLIASRCRHQDTLLLCAVSTACPVVLAAAAFFLESASNTQGIPTLVAIAGGGAGIWALLVGWAFKGMSQLAGLVRAPAQPQLDDAGELIAPVDHPFACARRENIMRNVVIGTCGTAAFCALMMVLAPAVNVITPQLLVCGMLSLALSGSLWLAASLTSRARLEESAVLFTTMLAVSSFFGALPFFFRAAEVGALAALSELPLALATALAALLAAGVLNTLRQPPALRAQRALRSATRNHPSHARAHQPSTRKVAT